MIDAMRMIGNSPDSLKALLEREGRKRQEKMLEGAA
jgi:hypothetical protein